MKTILNLMKKKIVKAGTIALAVLMAFGTTASTKTITAEAATASVIYKVHGACYGWQGERSNGATAGTEGQSLQLECFTAYLKGVNGGIEYRPHVQNYGWMSWTGNNAPAGTTGQGLRMEALEFRLTGEAAKYYDVEARSHCQNIGWTGWTRNGVTGTTGQGLRMEAIQVRLVPKASVNTTLNFSSLQSRYPSGSTWNSSYKNKAWQCHGFACLLGDALTGTDPYTWATRSNLNNLKAGDIVRFNRPHSIMITAVNGDTVTYVDCNWVGKNKVQWGQTINKNQLTSKFGSLKSVMVCPK